MLLKLAFDMLISPFSFKIALAVFNILTLYSNYCFAYFHMLLYISLGQLDIAGCALNLDLVVKLHYDPIGLLHF